MHYPSLSGLLQTLKASPRVKGLFTTGSTATGIKPSSDIDLVVILDKNTEGLKAVYTNIERHFSDIFFFDVSYLEGLKKMDEIPANGFEGMLTNWLLKGRIEHDPDGILTTTKEALSESICVVGKAEKQDVLTRINYSLIANRRYFSAEEELYHVSLEVRLLYSTVELVTSYFSLRGMPWRGEKDAMAYLAKHDPDYRDLLLSCIRTSSLDEKMKYYEILFTKTILDDDQVWKNDFVVMVPKNQDKNEEKELHDFWDELTEDEKR
ncbi:MAG: nucleotidyltransferase domain-containing protein [Candidatus Uhrbacteria bacterium]